LVVMSELPTGSGQASLRPPVARLDWCQDAVVEILQASSPDAFRMTGHGGRRGKPRHYRKQHGSSRRGRDAKSANFCRAYGAWEDESPIDQRTKMPGFPTQTVGTPIHRGKARRYRKKHGDSASRGGHDVPAAARNLRYRAPQKHPGCKSRILPHAGECRTYGARGLR
jgi:hypothetical protein